jgi:hypothetical protein
MDILEKVEKIISEHLNGLECMQKNGRVVSKKQAKALNILLEIYWKLELSESDKRSEGHCGCGKS